MSKQIRITLTEGNFHHSMMALGKDEYPYIYLDREITNEEAVAAADLITTYFMQQKLNKLIVVLDERNEALMPTKEMTLDEIEIILGHKVKIVKKRRNSDDK